MPAPNDAEPQVLPSREPTAEETFYYETAYKEPVESVKRIEDTAKFLAGAVATTSGLFVAAVKLSAGQPSAAGLLWQLPLALWWASLLALLLVLMPAKYKAGANEPAAWKQAFLKVRQHKYRWLVAGAVLFILGLGAAVLPLVSFGSSTS